MSPDELPPLGEIVVPDDARDLDRDLVAYRRELRAARRRARWGWFYGRAGRFGFERFRRPGTGALVVTGALLLSLVIGTLAVLVPSFVRSGGNRVPRPLSNPSRSVGQVGGLLPEAALTPASGSDVRPVDVRSLRPAALVLVPRRCGCAPAVSSVLEEARLVGIAAAIIAPGPAADVELGMLAGRSGAATGLPYLDPTGVLSTTYGATTTPALLTVDAGGVVGAVLPSLRGDASTDTAVRAAVEELVRTG